MAVFEKIKFEPNINMKNPGHKIKNARNCLISVTSILFLLYLYITGTVSTENIQVRYYSRMKFHSKKANDNITTREILSADIRTTMDYAYNSTASSTSKTNERTETKFACYNNPMNLQYREPHQRAILMKKKCLACYDEEPDETENCRENAGRGSFMISKELFLSVPNKCASQYMNQLAFSLMGLPQNMIKQENGTGTYSYRSAIQHQQKKFPKSDADFMCKSPEAERILIARHPILRIISAWNDKFNMNNTDPAGIPMGLSMLLKTQMGRSFHKDVSFLRQELNSYHRTCLSLPKVLGRNQLQEKCLPKKLRSYRENPWHLISFKDFIFFLVQRDPGSVNSHFSPIAFHTKTGNTRNPCWFDYTAIVKIEHMKYELKTIIENNTSFEIPKEFEELRHSSVGGLDPRKSETIVQQRIDDLFYNIAIPIREKLKRFYERDFVLFEYKWDIYNNKIY